MADLSLTNAAIAALSDSADKLIAASANAIAAKAADDQTIANLQADLASVDQTVASQIQPVVDKLAAATPAG